MEVHNMWNSGFFNSINGDRLYDADQMSRIFEGLITDGVYESVGDKLAVQPNNAMTIQIGTGRGWFNKRWVENSTPYTITLEASDVVLSRYAAICIRVDTSESGRTAQPYVKYSDYASAPNKPTMVRTETLNEYCLAYVYIKAGATEIKASNIEDTRGNNNLCGWVTGLIEQLSTTTLFEQWEALFNNWFNNLQDLINENTETMLVGALPKSETVTLSADSWVESDGAYTQTVAVDGITSTKTVICQSNDETAEAHANASVKCSGQDVDTLVFTAINLPGVDIKVDVTHFGI
jgi:hypothetical protein